MANLMNKLFGFKEYHFDFIGKKKILYIIALLVIIPGICVMIFSGLNLGIDFTGGTIVKITYTQDIDIADVRAVVSDMVNQTPTINDSEDNSFVIRTEDLGDEQTKAMVSALEELGPVDAELTRTNRIGPTIGGELLSNARWAILIAGVLMLLYITIRFKFNYAITAILALAHDVLVILSVFAIFRIEVDSSFVAAILTIVGYSINNTIIIFDRIRENTGYNSKQEFSLLVNQSINQTISRTVNTVLAVLILLIALLIFGGDTTKNFVLALTVGMVAGFYSSVFLVGNMLNDITKRFGAKAGIARSAKYVTGKR